MPTTTFEYTGAAQTFTVPSGCTQITVDAYGAKGATVEVSACLGGRTQGVINVTPGETLTLMVGGSGSTGGGFNGGGRGASANSYGGGATDVRRGTGLAGRLIVAPGGGSDGATGVLGGHGGGLTGLAGTSGFVSPSNEVAPGGAGGTQTTAGVGGGLGVGGSSNNQTGTTGGGGGGGYYGGGAGSSVTSGSPGGGGGGSALVPAGGSTTAGVRVGNGMLTLTYNSAPNAPTSLSPASAVNKDASNRFSWSFSDPDGDSQSAYDLRYRIIGAASWTAVSGSTPNAYRDFVAGTFVAADYEWQVRTYDAAGLVGAYSPSAFFSAAPAPAGPAITDPINGQTIPTASYVLTWSSPDQQEYEASILDADGAVVFTSGTVAEAATRSLLLSFPDNSATRTIRLRTRTAGLWSPYATVTVLVSYTTPAVAGVSVRPISTISSSTGTDAILVELANPAPTGGQPAVGSHRIFRRAGGTGDGVRIVVDHPAGQAYVDRTPASGVDYSYRVESIAANGTASTSEWIGDAVDLGVAPGDEGDFGTATFGTATFG